MTIKQNMDPHGTASSIWFQHVIARGRELLHIGFSAVGPRANAGPPVSEGVHSQSKNRRLSVSSPDMDRVHSLSWIVGVLAGNTASQKTDDHLFPRLVMRSTER